VDIIPAMDLHLTGKRALITGGSKGVGRAIASMLAAEGCDVILVARDPATLADAAASIRAAAKVRVEVIAADLSQQAEIERVADAVGAFDILVNNAGASPGGNLLAVDDPALRTGWDLKVFGFISLTRALYPALQRSSGVVINIMGRFGETFDPEYIAGATGNAALMAFTRAIGRFGHKDGVRCVGINPGFVATERNVRRFRDRAATELGNPERWPELTASMPFGRMAEPAEIAAAVAFLASPRSAYTSGTVLTIHGGA
jgi:NAD(P)-dependent dehydrogenase (short-subunit alcohol dehydrogenase family)